MPDRDPADPAREIGRLRAERDEAHDALRSLACWLSVGGYNAPLVDPAEFERKIRAGVDALIRVETARARGPQISDSEQVALLRRTVADLEERCQGDLDFRERAMRNLERAEAAAVMLAKAIGVSVPSILRVFIQQTGSDVDRDIAEKTLARVEKAMASARAVGLAGE
jgi:hypothetical protein